jgi:hypothetical protein
LTPTLERLDFRPDTTRAVRNTAARTRGEALAAARAVFEARVLVGRHGSGDQADLTLYALEMAFFRLADSLKETVTP